MKKINFLTAGESHGKGLLGIIEGMPSGIEISSKYINAELGRRQKGFGRGGRMKIENDKVDIYSGLRHGKTLGSPIGLVIRNLDWDNWKDTMSVTKSKIDIDKITLPRPGHADLAGVMKYGFDDIRNVIERSSARETTMRVAIGSICKKMLEYCNIHIGSYVSSIYNINDNKDYSNDYSPLEINHLADKSPIRTINKSVSESMINAIKEAQQEGDSIGGKFNVIISGLPYGLGNYTQWNKKLNALLAESICSINAIKNISFGLGDAANEVLGSEMHDEIFYDKKYIRSSNNAGGIEGGMSNAQPIILTATMKPLSTLVRPLNSADIATKEKKLAHKERTDSCAVPSAAVIAEHMAAITISDAILDKFGGDSINQLLEHMKISARY